MAEKKKATSSSRTGAAGTKTTGTTKKSQSSQTTRKAAQSRSKPTAAERAVDANQEGALLSSRAICAMICLVLFVLFTIMALNPDGALLKLLYLFLMGTMGATAFYVSIPILLWLSIILIFSKNRPVILRSVCLILFIVTAGCISQLTMKRIELPAGFGVIGALYQGGISGTTAGLLCGGLGLGLRWLLGSVLSFIVLILGAILLLMAAVDLTIPSLVRAFRDRPRPEPEEEEEPPARPEPAQVVVNHIANMQMERAERRRQRAEAAEIDIPLEDDPKPRKKKKEDRQRSRAAAIMSELSSDLTAPVAAAEPEPDEQSCTPEEEDFEPPYEEEVPFEEEPPCEEPEEEPEEDLAVEAQPQVRRPILTRDFEITPISEEEYEALNQEPPQPVVPTPAAAPKQAPAVQSTPVQAATTQAAPAAAAPQKVTAKDAAESAAEVAAEVAKNEEVEKREYCYPPIDLLHLPAGSSGDGTEEMRENSRRLNETLASFKIEAHIINVTRGPSVTRYEVELDRGVRLNKLTTSADDIALNLGASGVRIAAVPGKISVVGIEVPNKSVTTVSLREVIGSPEFTKAKSKSSFAVGKDIGGNCIVGNIAKLPHMLIAGTTGSGKSVCMNSIIISLLYKASPDDVKLIMVDPKMVELGIYNGIPHLLIPVVTDPKKAAGSLQWAVTEMMRRYRAMSDAGVRDLESYNSIVDSQEEGGKHLPQVVVIIDELADLMLVAAKEVEESICRIAQMGRAAGIHLIIATQRPSADVITGLMKANIPSRIAFAVASAMESRIILDTQGAEKLVGKGDMLYAPIGCGKPKRVQGSWVSESEVEAVATYIKSNFQTDYDETVMEEIDKKAEQTGNKSSSSDVQPNADEMEGDEMLPNAVEVILETGQASVSMLQRRLKLGYARAARIVDEMEEMGIVGPFVGSKPRSILITKEQWLVMKNGGQAPIQEELPEEPEEDPDLVPADEEEL